MGDFGNGVAAANSDWVNALWPVFGFDPQVSVMTGSSKDAAEKAAGHAQGCLDELNAMRKKLRDCEQALRECRALLAARDEELEELMESMGAMAAENIRLSLHVKRLKRQQASKSPGGE